MPRSWNAWSPTEFTARAAAAAADRVVRLLGRLPEELAELLRAIVVAGRDFDTQLIGRLAGLRTMSAAKALEELQETEVLLRGRRPELAEATAERVLAAMDVGHRENMYARAAALGYRAAIPEDSLARLLLPACPVNAQWAIDVLRREASRSRVAGDHRGAAALLTRALREPSDAGIRARLQTELALAEMPDRPQAADRRLGEVLLSPGGRELMQARLHAADLLLGKGNEELVRSAASAVGTRPETSGKERCTLAALYWLAEDAPHDAPELSVPALPPLPEDPRCPQQAGVVAWQVAVRGTDRERARSLALVALADTGPLLSSKIQACRTLMLTGDETTALAGLDQAIATARECEASPLIAMSLIVRGKLNARDGRLDDAEADLESALAELPRQCWHPLMLPLLASLEALLAIERGQLDRAEEVLAGPWRPGDRHAFSWAQLLLVRGVARLLSGRHEEALENFQECGRRMLARQWTNPALLAWRSMAAIALRALGRDEEAVLLVGEEIRLAELWGEPAVIGGAHLGAALATQGDEAERHGTEAVGLLRDSPWRTRYVFALVELAAVKVQSGTAADAIPLLSEAHRLAADLGAGQHIRRIHEIAARIAAMLSPVERRVVEVAARGVSNAAIAADLAVTRRTVEAHLTSIYRKAGIAGRADLLALRDLLGQGGARDVVGA
jgi:DNA-binding CsgD family transcriptional regulator